MHSDGCSMKWGGSHRSRKDYTISTAYCFRCPPYRFFSERPTHLREVTERKSSASNVKVLLSECTRKKLADMHPRFLTPTLACSGSIPVRIQAAILLPHGQCRLARDKINRSPLHHLFRSPFRPSRRYSAPSTIAPIAITTVKSSSLPNMYPSIEPYDTGMLEVSSLHTL